MAIKCTKALLACLIGSGIVVYAQTPELKSYHYPIDGFQVSFPMEPKLPKGMKSTESGNPETRMYSIELPQALYYVAVTDCGKVAITADPNAMLQAGKKGSLDSMKARLISEQKIKLSVVPGLAFDSEADGYHYQTRFYMAGSILYQIIVGYPIGKKPSDAEGFLDSFGLITRSIQ